ncbi:hypothetical protein HZB96_05705, partial [Candidatus Gottesmanbacteria bacterium]|nr:hypothetical protein [Candidatus Gottesmanbacteria bacterium]
MRQTASYSPNMQNIEAFQSIPQTVMDIYEPAAPDIHSRLYPTLEAIGRIYTGVLGVLDKNSIKEEQILAYLDTPGLYSPRQHISVEGRD